MKPEDVVEAFVSTILIAVMGIVIVSIYNPEFGQTLSGILPDIVNIAVYIFLGLFITALALQIVDNF